MEFKHNSPKGELFLIIKANLIELYEGKNVKFELYNVSNTFIFQVDVLIACTTTRCSIPFQYLSKWNKSKLFK